MLLFLFEYSKSYKTLHLKIYTIIPDFFIRCVILNCWIFIWVRNFHWQFFHSKIILSTRHSTRSLTWATFSMFNFYFRYGILYFKVQNGIGKNILRQKSQLFRVASIIRAKAWQSWLSRRASIGRSWVQGRLFGEASISRSIVLQAVNLGHDAVNDESNGDNNQPDGNAQNGWNCLEKDFQASYRVFFGYHRISHFGQK